MKLGLYYLLFLLQVVMGASDSTSSSSSSSTSVEPTLVWVTATTNGVTTVTQSPYTQTFTSMYSETAQAKSGAIGLGSLSGEVGGVRTYSVITASEGGACALTPFTSLHSQFGLSGLTTLLVGMMATSSMYLVLM